MKGSRSLRWFGGLFEGVGGQGDFWGGVGWGGKWTEGQRVLLVGRRCFVWDGEGVVHIVHTYSI